MDTYYTMFRHRHIFSQKPKQPLLKKTPPDKRILWRSISQEITQSIKKHTSTEKKALLSEDIVLEIIV
jgi:hypothetical protein